MKLDAPAVSFMDKRKTLLSSSLIILLVISSAYSSILLAGLWLTSRSDSIKAAAESVSPGLNWSPYAYAPVRLKQKAHTASMLERELEVSVSEVDVLEEEGVVKQVICIQVTADSSPIEGASVYVNARFVGYTDASGFVYCELEPGTYLISARKVGYVPSAELYWTVEEASLREKLMEKLEAIREKLPPILVMKDLYPEHFVLGDDESYTVTAIAIDNKGLSYAKLLYSNNGADWVEASTEINRLVQTEVVEFRTSLPKIFEVKGTIPPHQAGTVVFYKFVVEDLDGNEFEGPMGLYFVVDDESSLKVMIVDPWVKLWLLKQNAKQFTETLSDMAVYDVGAKWFGQLLEEAQKVKKFNIVKRHYWERIGNYNFIIVNPDEVEASLEEFKPNVIILSNLLLNEWVVPDELIRYCRGSNAGLIATHGTIFDEVVWTGNTREEATEVGARAHVGDTPEAYENETVALLLGLILSPIVEYGRDQIAEFLCKSEDPYSQAIGRAIGTTPLHPSYVPFSGRFIVEEQHEVTQGLGTEFEVEIPSSVYTERHRAYTTLGWQYVFPSKLSSVTKEKVVKIKEKVEPLYEELCEFGFTYAGHRSTAEDLMSGLDLELLDSAEHLSIEDAKIKISIKGYELEFSGERARLAIEFFKKYRPAKVVAVSDDYLAGVIVHDEWFRADGVRAVYISFEAESSTSDSAWKLLSNSIEWSSKFEFKISEVTQDMAKLLREMGTPLETREVLWLEIVWEGVIRWSKSLFG